MNHSIRNRILTAGALSATLLAVLGTTGMAISTVHAAALPGVRSITLNPAVIAGGTPVTATVTLAAPAGGSGLTVSLSSSATSVATTATTLTVPANQTSASTTITTYPTGLNVNTLP